MDITETELVLSADFSLKTTDSMLQKDTLATYPELKGKYALIDTLYNTTYLINESIYQFLQLFSSPTRVNDVFTAIGVDKTTNEQVTGFVQDLRQKEILITPEENETVKEHIAQEQELPPIDIDPARIIKVMKHTRYVWIGLVRGDHRPEPYVLKKFLLPASLSDHERNKRIADFMHEATMHTAASGHPHIVTLYAADFERYEMELAFVEGKSVRKHVKATNPPLHERYRLISSILAIFESLHAKGILHGDIHSSNFLVTKDNEPILFDFDMARDILQNKDATRVGGVYPYAPPERISTAPMQVYNGMQTSKTAEVYQLGIIFYQILYHELPFDEATWKDLSGSILTLPPVWKPQTPAGEFIPPMVIKTLQQALEKDPGKRFASVNDFAAAWQHTITQVQG